MTCKNIMKYLMIIGKNNNVTLIDVSDKNKKIILF